MPKISTQDFLEIEQIKEGVLILKNKSLRAILGVSSLNFALKAEDEQNAIIYQFQNFLNSLDFSCQIVIQSRRLNMTGYLDKLKDIEIREKNELLKLQIADYRNFVQGILEQGYIMQKSFYVVIPFSLSETQGISVTKRFAKVSSLTEEEFARSKNQLMQRVEFAILGLRACGLGAATLNNPELIELFWGLYHPTEAERGYYPEVPTELTD
jgi:KaiC/GvpD/RAD55 family RecA-like ATPase